MVGSRISGIETMILNNLIISLLWVIGQGSWQSPSATPHKWFFLVYLWSTRFNLVQHSIAYPSVLKFVFSIAILATTTVVIPSQTWTWPWAVLHSRSMLTGCSNTNQICSQIGAQVSGLRPQEWISDDPICQWGSPRMFNSVLNHGITISTNICFCLTSCFFDSLHHTTQSFPFPFPNSIVYFLPFITKNITICSDSFNKLWRLIFPLDQARYPPTTVGGSES